MVHLSTLFLCFGATRSIYVYFIYGLEPHGPFKYTLSMILEPHDPSMYTLSLVLDQHDTTMYIL